MGGIIPIVNRQVYTEKGDPSMKRLCDTDVYNYNMDIYIHIRYGYGYIDIDIED